MISDKNKQDRIIQDMRWLSNLERQNIVDSFKKLKWPKEIGGKPEWWSSKKEGAARKHFAQIIIKAYAK